MKKLNWLILVLALMQACAVKKQVVPVGNYVGELPCADCPGIKYSLSLNKDRTYSESSTYLDREDGTFLDSGKFEIVNDTILHLKNKPKNSGLKQFFIKKDQLVMLDIHGKPIESGYADWYILNKASHAAQQIDLSGKWVLAQMNSTTVEGDRAPYIEFQLDAKRFSGFGGCNRIGGNFELTDKSIQFGMIMATKMACADDQYENEFLKTLNEENWKVEQADQSLTLSNASGKLVFQRDAASSN
ncbi:copper resistance protein NlpE N-terminal domain-containing protein [Sunxiuqinia sp. sy24]|uniref:copper resistance protein NlpE N-terminal domain-containing protein n=1 Tax=Sunxiuqinia sp. sy24 TaxID=3461495 RepID=UPI0040456AA1